MTDKQITEYLNEMVIICDTRENENSHIIDYFKKNNIKYVVRGLKFGDYSFELPELSRIGADAKPFEFKIVVERKASLEEISGNLSQNRERFENEFSRAAACNAKVIVMVESGSYEDIINHKYGTDLNPKSFMASIFAFKTRYNLGFEFVPKKLAGLFIYATMKYYLREYLKGT
jgi:ERCC4-type nuclease